MSLASAEETILAIKNLQVSFRSVAGTTRAVNGVGLNVRAGEIMGLVGESGCGKSVTIRSVVGLVPSPPAVFEGGEIWLRTREGLVETLSLRRNMGQLRRIRGRDISMIFQEPMRSLHPMMPIGHQIAEGIQAHELVDQKEAYDRTVHMLELVGLPNPSGQMSRYAHELSGGMRQRALIALALVGHPKLLLADEPTTALDVTIQAQILDLIRNLQERLGMSVLLITHNMGVVANIADRVSVMYLGKIVETGTVHEVFREAAHPYTQGLLASMPSLFGEPKTRLPSLRGVVPELAAAPRGCVFADRCPYVMAICDEVPSPVRLTEEHSVACWLYDGSASSGYAAGEIVQRSVTAAAASRWMDVVAEQEGKALAVTTSMTKDGPNSLPTACQGQVGLLVDGSNQIQVRLEGIALHYPVIKGLLRRRVGTCYAVDGVDLTIHKGETLGLVGESGCGKTSVGRVITRLVDPTAGNIWFRTNGKLRDITGISQQEMKAVRRHMGMVFQDPLSSLNPRMNVRTIVGEPLILHGIARGRKIDDRVGQLLEMVGLRPEHQSRFPHAFSGGQRQRIAIARALATQPTFLVADESVSSLDVSVQAQVLNLMMDLQRQLSLAMLFIAHDIAVVRHVSDRIAVMYLGKIVEVGDANEVCSLPKHPYTEMLLASIPLPVPGLQRAVGVPSGELPDPINPPSGCRFHTRCPYRRPICENEDPVLRACGGSPDHLVACHFEDELSLKGVEALNRKP